MRDFEEAVAEKMRHQLGPDLPLLGRVLLEEDVEGIHEADQNFVFAFGVHLFDFSRLYAPSQAVDQLQETLLKGF